MLSEVFAKVFAHSGLGPSPLFSKSEMVLGIFTGAERLKETVLPEC